MTLLGAAGGWVCTPYLCYLRLRQRCFSDSPRGEALGTCQIHAAYACVFFSFMHKLNFASQRILV
eukprot:4092785-Amphidinium_carterae.2